MATVRKIRFQGDRAVELRTRGLRLVAVTSRGPRIAFLNRAGRTENLLLWQPGKYRRGGWDLLGGHRLWLARPGADEAEETYAPDSASCTVELRRDGFVVTAPAERHSRIEKALGVRAVAEDRLMIEHRITNRGDMLWSGGIWGLTCTVPTPASTYVVPLSDGSMWDTASVTLFKRWGGTHAGRYDDPQFSFSSDAMIVRSLGEENKRAVRAAPGIIGWHDRDRDVLFVKRAEYRPGAVYPLDSNLAIYTGEASFMVEVETMSPLVTLKPGESVTHVETWVLRPAPRAIPGAAALGRVAASRGGGFRLG